MDNPEVPDSAFRVGEVGSGPDQHQIVISYDRVRFVLFVTRPDDREDDALLADFYDRVQTARKGTDRLSAYRCALDLGRLAISDCKHTMLCLSATIQKPNSKTLSLQDFLYPITFHLQLRSVNGKLEAIELDDNIKYTGMHAPLPFPVDFAPESMPSLIPFRELDFVQNLCMKKVIKVSRNGEISVFKSTAHSDESQIQREINLLQQISETWTVDHPTRPKVPRFLGLVSSEGQIVGFLQEFIVGADLSSFDMQDVSSDRRRKWKQQIEHSINKLHLVGIVWGDVKAENVMIDNADNAWLIDFGGSWTEDWVDEELAETMEGDLQGLSRIEKFLRVGESNHTSVDGLEPIQTSTMQRACDKDSIFQQTPAILGSA